MTNKNDMNPGEEMQAVIPPGIGEQLKRARLERKLTLLEVSDAIHIKVSYLEALERDDFEHMPVPIYTKNYIFKCGNYLGLDGKALADQFQNMMGDTTYSFPSNSVPMSQRVREQQRQAAGKGEEGDVMPRHWLLFAVIVLGIIVALVKVSGKARRAREESRLQSKAASSAQVQAPRTELEEELAVIRSAKQELKFAEKLPETD